MEISRRELCKFSNYLSRSMIREVFETTNVASVEGWRIYKSSQSILQSPLYFVRIPHAFVNICVVGNCTHSG